MDEVSHRDWDLVWSPRKSCHVVLVGVILLRIYQNRQGQRLHQQYHLVGGIPTPLKNDGVRQWEGWHPLYEMENKKNVWNHRRQPCSSAVFCCTFSLLVRQFHTGFSIPDWQTWQTATKYNKSVAKCDVVCPSSAIWATVGDVSLSHLNP